jgi:hypothetical protein
MYMILVGDSVRDGYKAWIFHLQTVARICELCTVVGINNQESVIERRMCIRIRIRMRALMCMCVGV